jgi:gamma-glutamyltranspeptidase/glutathione hydrolase
MFTTRPEILGTFGVVASTHWLASATGMAILEKDGNAFDAAVATAFVLQLVEPHLNGPGGEVPIILHDAKSKATRVLCGQGVAPAKATIAHYRSLGLDYVPGTGFLAATTPGAFDAWMLMLRDYGSKTVRDVLSPVIAMAERGYPLVPRIPQAIEGVAELFTREWKSSAAIFLPHGSVPKPGTLFRNRDIAATYTRIIKEAEAAGGDRVRQIEAARAAWYRGFVAEAIDRFMRTEVMDTTGRRNAGVMTADDLASWQATYESPLTYQYGRYTVNKCGPWSQGPAFLQQLAILKHLGIDGTEPVGPDFVHKVVEAAKLAFADREAYYGDPNFVKVPLDVLLSDPYNAERARLVGDRASRELRPGKVPGFDGRVDYALAASRIRPKDFDSILGGIGEPTMKKEAEKKPLHLRGAAAGDTCHLDVVDSQGNMVSATPSGGWLSSSPVVPGLGFPLGTRGQMFWLDDTAPNRLEPGKRPRTTLTPSFAHRDGEPYMPFGTPGGDQQDQWQVTFFLHHAHHGMNLQQAIDCPNFHTEHFPSSFYPRGAKPGRLVMEGRFPKETVEALKARGHDVEVGLEWSEGRLSAAAKDGELLKAAANPRGMQGYAIGR